MKLCPNCHTENDNDAKFCKECAASFTENDASNVKQPQILQSPTEPSEPYATSTQEVGKDEAPLDYLIGKVSSRFNKLFASSEDQSPLWQKAKDWFKESYNTMFLLIMMLLK